MMKMNGTIRQPMKNGMRQPHSTITSAGIAAFSEYPRSAATKIATC